MPEPPALPNPREAASEDAAVGATWLQTRALLRVISVILAVVAVLWALYTLEGVILLVVLSTFFAYFIAPLVELVRRPFIRHRREHLMPRPLAIAVVYLMIFGSIGLGAYLLLPGIGDQLTQFARQAPAYMAHVRDRLQGWTRLMNPDRFPAPIRDAAANTMARTVETAEAHLTAGAVGVLELVTYLPWLVLIPILAFFLLKDADTFRRSALMSLPQGHLRGRGAEFFQEVNQTLAAYIRAQLTACLIIGTVCTVGFVIMRVPYALMLGILAGVLEFIPLVGPLVVALSAFVIASFHSLSQALGVLVFLGVLRIVHDYIVYPRLIGRGIHLHPLAVILAILCGAELGGVAGIFLAIPVTAVLSVSYRHWLEYRGSAGLVAELLEPPEPGGAVVLPAEARALPPEAPLKK